MKKRIQKSIQKVFACIVLLSASYQVAMADCNEYWDDFNTNRNIISYDYMDGTLNQSAANPSPNFVNSSSTCGRYNRSTTLYDNIVCQAYVGDGDYYRSGRKIFKMDVYSSVPGTIINLTICNSTMAQGAYPIGRHSVYEAVTTKTNEWETLVFVHTGNPDPTVPGDAVNQVVIQFAPNTTTTPTYYYDNFVSVFTVVWDDFDYVSPSTYVFSNGVYSEGGNPAPSLINSSTNCAQYTRDAGSLYDVVVFSTPSASIGWADDYKAGYYSIKISVYSPAAGIPVALTFDKASVAQVQPFPLGRHSVYGGVTTVANQWEVITLVFQGAPDPSVGPTEVDELVLQFNPNTNTGGTYYFDDLMAVPNVPTIASTITGSTTVCQSQNSVTYSVTAVAGSTFNWSVPTGATIASGAGTNSITVNYGASAASGYVAVKRINELLCEAPWRSVAVTVNPGPTANANVDQTVCKSATSVTLAGSVGGSATSGTWSTSGTGTFSPNTLTGAYTPSATDKTNGTVTLTLTSSGGTCGTITDAMIVTLVAPSANANIDQTICSNVSSVTLAGSVGGSATGGTWSTSGTGTFSPNTLTGAYTPSATDKTNGTVNLTLTSSGGSCGTTTDVMTVTITAVPTANASVDQTICSSISSVTLAGSVGGSATGGTWSTSGTGTFSPNTPTGSYTPSATDKTNGGVVLTLTTTGGCATATDVMNLVINASPTVNANVDQTICSNISSVTLAGSIGGGATGGTWSTSGSGTFSPNTPTGSYTPSATDKTNGTVNLTLTTSGGSCGTVTDVMTVTITAVPTANASTDQTICSSVSSVTLAGSVGGSATGGTWSTSGSGTFSPNSLTGSYLPSATDKTNGAVVLTLTTSGGCATVTDVMNITINASPTVNANVDQTICANASSVTLAGVTGGGATGGTWSTSGTGTFTPNATTLGATYTPSVADKSTTLTLTLTTSGGSCGTVNDQMTVSFISPSADAGNDAAICASGSPAVSLNGSIGGTATSGTWSTTGTGTFSPDANTLTATYNASAADITAGTVTLTLTTSGGSCGTTTDNMTITVSSSALANAGPDQSICNNVTATLDGFVSGGATGGTWTGGTGTFTPNATTLTATYTPSATEIANGSVTLTLTTTGGTCTTGSDQVTITLTTCTDVFGAIQTERIQLYPNPNTGLVRIDLAAQQDVVECQLTNSMGVYIKNIPVTTNSTEIELATEDLSNGVYYLMFKNSANKLFYKKMIKL